MPPSSSASNGDIRRRWPEPTIATGRRCTQLARRMCDAEDADDVTHEVFLALWRAPERYDPERASLPNHLLTQTYREARRQLNTRPSRGPGGPPGPGDRQPERRRLSGEDAWRLLVRLQEEKRRAIVAAYFGEHTYQQVADLLSEQDGTVSTHLYACMTELRARLAVDAFFDKMDLVTGSWPAPRTPPPSSPPTSPRCPGPVRGGKRGGHP